MALLNIDMVISEDKLAKVKETSLIPIVLLSNPMAAQIMYDFSLIVSMIFSFFFTPFLSYIVMI